MAYPSKTFRSFIQCLYLIIAASLLIPLSSAQSEDVEDAWADIRPSEEKAADGSPQPQTIYRLDAVKFDGYLRSAPQKGSGKAALLLKLPMPDGTRMVFQVQESPIMEPGLAARFPTIKTYTLRSVDDPSITGRMDRNHRNLHVLLLTQQGAVQINPDTELDHPHYRSVYEKTSAADLFCGVEETIPSLVYAAAGSQSSTESLQSLLSNTKAGLAAAAIPSGDTLRTYRLAIATTGEYYNGWENGGGDADVLAAITTVVNRVNAVYEVEVAITFTLIANTDDLFFTDGTTDGYSDGAPCTMRNENTPIINATIPVGDYDIGHVFGMIGGGGCAGGSVVCDDNNKGNGASGLNVTGDPGQEGFSGYRLVAHEMGHQFGAGHTWSGSQGSCTAGQFSANNAYEPLSGSTLMAYSGICGSDNVKGGTPDDPYFHTRSFDQIVSFSTLGAGDACAVSSATGNSAPVVDAGPDYTIPQQTPFVLTGSANDPDSDPLSYAWEQFDLAPGQISPLTDMGNNPLFRSFPPVPNDPSRTFPQLSDILNNTTTTGELLPTTDRTMNFRLTARDNLLNGGGVDYDGMVVTVSGDPFFILSPNGGETLNTGCSTDVTWQVGGGSVATNVNLLLSEDGGFNFATWAAGTDNDGSETLTVPCDAATAQGRAKAEAVDNIFFDISDADFTVAENAPVIVGSATGGDVDDSCMFEVTFEATVTDDCSVAAGDVSVDVSELTSNATLAAPTINIAQGDGTTVNVTGSVVVSDLTSSPAIVRVEVTGVDGCGLQTVETFDADVVDTTPPSIDVVLDPSSLWPPNHMMHTITADVTVDDNCPVTDFTLTSVTSNEPDDDTGDGATTDDIQDAEIGTADTSFSVRAERKGDGGGRIYTASYNVTDGSGNDADGSSMVIVKHSKKKSK